jgi:branched-chain amino acid transport system ATP-binding protein
VLAGLNPSEIRDVIPVIHAIRDAGVTILLIEHVMQAVMSLSDYTWVLNQGAIIAEGPRRMWSPIPMSSKPISARAWRNASPSGRQPVLEVSNLRSRIRCGRGVARHRLVHQQGRDRDAAGVQRRRQDDVLSGNVSGLMQPWSGSITFEGQTDCRVYAAGDCRRGLIQVPEGRHVFPNMTVRENLELGSYRRGKSNRTRNIEHVAEIFPRLRERFSQNAGTLSGGEQQMLAIGRGMMAEPQLLILDEPSIGLSPLLVEEMFSPDQAAQHRRDLTILLVEQNVLQSMEIADRAFVMENGEIKLSGIPADLMDDPELQRSYLGLA